MQKIVIDSKALNNSLKKLTPVFNSKNMNPLLENVLTELKDGTLTLTATDMHLTIIASMDLEGEPFKALLPYGILRNIAGVLTGDVEIQINDDLEGFVKSKKEAYKLGKTVSPDMFVTISQFDEKYSIPVDGTFFYSLSQAVKSTDSNPNELRFSCVLLDFLPNELRVVSSARSNAYVHQIATDKKFKHQALFLPDFVKAVKDFQEAQLTISDRFICAKTDSLTVFATCSEQRFPEYQFFLTAEKSNCTVAKADLQAAVNKMLVYNSPVPEMMLHFIPGAIKTTLIENGTAREANAEFPAKHDVPEQSVSVLATLLNDLLSQCPAGTEHIDFIIPGNAPITMLHAKPVTDDRITLALGVIPK